MLSSFRLHKETQQDPWKVIKNPAPLLTQKGSLDYVCNFNFGQFLADNPGVPQWIGGHANAIQQMTYYLLDFIVVYVASSLARYYVPAWRAIIEGEKTDIYNDIRAAYRTVSEDLPYFLASQYPFKYSFDTDTP